MEDRSKPFQAPPPGPPSNPPDTSRYLIDYYRDWSTAEGIPIVEASAVDLTEVETAPWARLGPSILGAFAHLKGRGDFLAAQVIDIPPGAETDPCRHLYDEIFYVLSGQPKARLECDRGKAAEFDLRPQAFFAPTINMPFRISNRRGRQPARLVGISNLPFMMKLFRNESFLFGNPFSFAERIAPQNDGRPPPEGATVETNFLADLAAMQLSGAGGHADIIPADSAIEARVVDIPAGGCEPVDPHDLPAHMLALTGSGEARFGTEGDEGFERHLWKRGLLLSSLEGTALQLVNTGAEPMRYLKVSVGNARYPVLAQTAPR